MYNSEKMRMWYSIFTSTIICNLVGSVCTISNEDVNQRRILSYIRLPGVVKRPQLLKSIVRDSTNIYHGENFISRLPKSFDPRIKWPECPSLLEIRDQGRCGSCWAVSSVAAMTDRVCIHSNGTKHFHFSAEDLVTCDEYQYGCQGGDPLPAWGYWVDNGLVSGGNYGSKTGCKPYSIPTCANHMINCRNYSDTPKCIPSCRKGYNDSYKNDKKRGENAYNVMGGEKNMMAELYKNGPIVVTIQIYEDLANYTGGVYQHVSGQPCNYHAVKLMGWGVEKGEKYWLLANSWGTDFGEKGFFKMLRGTDESGIESLGAAAGLPLLSDY